MIKVKIVLLRKSYFDALYFKVNLINWQVWKDTKTFFFWNEAISQLVYQSGVLRVKRVFWSGLMGTRDQVILTTCKLWVVFPFIVFCFILLFFIICNVSLLKKSAGKILNILAAEASMTGILLQMIYVSLPNTKYSTYSL